MNGYEKMREACNKMYDLLMLRGDGKTHCILTWDEFNDSQKMLKAALSAPPRNCDVGTVEEQDRRFALFCKKALEGPCASCTFCPIGSAEISGINECGIAWAQMPYEAQEGDAE